MRACIYLYQRIAANRVKKALRRPVTYVVGLVVLLYAAAACVSFSLILEEGGLASPETLTTCLSLLIFGMIPGNLLGYARRRGLVFSPGDVHFVFPAPIHPKLVLMLAGVRSFALNILLGTAVTAAGIWLFHAGTVRMLLFFLFFVALESVLEAGIILFCYGNERLPERFFKGLTALTYVFFAVVIGIAVFLLLSRRMSFGLLQEFFSMDAVLMVPIVGWNVAAVRLIFLGPDPVAVAGTVLYLASTAAVFLAALRMRCTGEYYEDAMGFAEELRIRKEKMEKGDGSYLFGKKWKKMKAASVEYKGSYAKAIYYRQLLEYRKCPTFIFGWNTLLNLGVGILVAAVGHFHGLGEEFGAMKVFLIPAVAAYVAFLFSGYATRWSKELENPYTYLIPDTPLRKLWHATKIEHIRAAVDGILLTAPGALVLGIGPATAVLTVFWHVCLRANHLYYNMLADALVGRVLGNTGRSIVKLLFQGAAIALSAFPAVLGGVFLGAEAGLFLMAASMGLLTLAGAALASVSFSRMEALC